MNQDNELHHQPYTYLIGWSQLNKYYYGVRFAKGCSPREFWIKYKTSSKIVKEFVNNYGEPDIISIRKTFSTPEKAIRWEEKVLRKMNVLHDDKWLNSNIAGAIRLVYHTKEHIEKRTKNKKHNINQRAFALIASKAAAIRNTGKKQSIEAQIKKKKTFLENIDTNREINRKNATSEYLIEGKHFSCCKDVTETYNISFYHLRKRIKDPNFDWHCIRGKGKSS